MGRPPQVGERVHVWQPSTGRGRSVTVNRKIAADASDGLIEVQDGAQVYQVQYMGPGDAVARTPTDDPTLIYWHHVSSCHGGSPTICATIRG